MRFAGNGRACAAGHEQKDADGGGLGSPTADAYRPPCHRCRKSGPPAVMSGPSGQSTCRSWQRGWHGLRGPRTLTPVSRSPSGVSSCLLDSRSGPCLTSPHGQGCSVLLPGPDGPRRVPRPRQLPIRAANPVLEQAPGHQRLPPLRALSADRADLSKTAELKLTHYPPSPRPHGCGLAEWFRAKCSKRNDRWLDAPDQSRMSE